MLTLPPIGATAEQLPIISSTRIGTEIIRGAAGSGKTSTAILRLESLSDYFMARYERLGVETAVKVLILTFNRTLAGYVENLSHSCTDRSDKVSCDIKTFSAWAREKLGGPEIIDVSLHRALVLAEAGHVGLSNEFLLSEFDYVCGRFPIAELDNYLAVERTGRGLSPQITRLQRGQLIDAIRSYYARLATFGTGQYVDWHSLAGAMLSIPPIGYDIVIIDEAQDFSVNQLRAVRHHLSQDHCMTLVMDTAQRLYPRGFTWAEVGIDATKARFHRLHQNHRNTVEICRFASAIVGGMRIDDDGTLPDFTTASRSGPKPKLCLGKYNRQLHYALEWINENVDLRVETVAFLKPRGGGWFDDLKKALELKGLGFVEITRDREWPTGSENIALCTMHSSKGLEFDHVVIIGLSNRNIAYGAGEEDNELLTLRRLLAMSVSRARKSVIIGYKPTESSGLEQFFDPTTFEAVNV